MYKIKTILLSLAFCALLASCDNQNAETAAENEEALTAYRDYVTEFESDSLSEVEMRAMQQAAEDSMSWEQKKANLQERYNERRERVEKSLEELTQEQQTEVQQLDERYNRALMTREQQYQDASHRYRLRRDLLGLKVRNDDLSDITAENVVPTYEGFVEALNSNATAYDTRDWQLIEGWWSALNSRYRTLEGNLSTQMKNNVQQAQNRYQDIRQQANINGM
ncbi:MAG: hypothetical protein LPK03_03315 [Pontibacter sp.]|nr:hypothetical protein [Pontibacter sp.]